MIFEEAIKDQDVINVMHKSGNKYRHMLSNELLYSCKMIGVWKACEKWNPDKDLKFTGWIYNCVRFECLHTIEREKPKIKFETISGSFDDARCDNTFL